MARLDSSASALGEAKFPSPWPPWSPWWIFLRLTHTLVYV